MPLSGIAKRDYMRQYYRTHPGYREKARKRNHERYLRHRSERIQYSVKFKKEHYLRTTGDKYLYIPFKRPKPKQCELCGKIQFLSYHHWYSNNRLIIGLWLCHRCHNVAEAIDKGILETYFMMKARAEQEVRSRIVC